MAKYLVVGQHSWSRNAFNVATVYLPGDKWEYFNDNPDFLPHKIRAVNPEKIFFTHWSYIVPDDIVNEYECICFHPSHLPYGRGGTPVQNLIRLGFTETRLTAFRMTSEIDAGPIYLQYPLSLEGSAQEIYTRIAHLSWDMIKIILKNKVQPLPQAGTPTYFSRRQPNESEIVGDESLEELYDHIRMLSAESYPHAFIEYGDYIIEFMEPSKASGCILANAVIIKKED